MTFKELQSLMVKAMKDGDKFKKGVLSVAIAQIKNAAIDKGCKDNITEDVVDAELLKSKKIAQEMLDTCPSFREDLLAAYTKQLEIITELAPTLKTDENEIRLMILDIVNGEYEFTKQNKGKIMKLVMPVLRGKVDMGIANKTIDAMLIGG